MHFFSVLTLQFVPEIYKSFNHIDCQYNHASNKSKLFLFQGDTRLPLMYGVFLMIALLGALATSFIPETFKQPFPECIEDVDRRKTYKYFSWRVWSQ